MQRKYRKKATLSTVSTKRASRDEDNPEASTVDIGDSPAKEGREVKGEDDSDNIHHPYPLTHEEDQAAQALGEERRSVPHAA